MKRTILTLVILIAALQIKAQQQATFKPVFSPKTTYSDTRTMDMVMDMETSGQDVHMNMGMTSISVSETGATDKYQNTPVKISVKTTDIKMTMNGNEMPGSTIPPVATTVYGKYGADGKLSIDSVGGQKINDSLRTTMLKMVEALQNNLKFPDHPVKIGESFSVDSPFDMGAMMPMSKGGTMTVKMTYKLLNIANDVAGFEITENMDIDLSKPDPSKTPGMTVVMKGTGVGTMSYDLKKQCLLTMVNKVDMNYDMGFSGQVVKGKGTMTSKDNVVIAAN